MNYTNNGAELEVLSRIMRDNKMIFKAIEDISPEDFFNTKNKLIFTSMKERSKNNQGISPITLFDSLKGSEITLPYLLEINNTAAATKDIQTYVDIVKENSRKRQYVSILRNSISKLSESTFDEISHETMAKLYQVNEKSQTSTFIDSGQLMGKVLDFIQEGQKSNGESIGMKTGWKSIDMPLKGFHKGDIVLIGARPSMGKTAFALNLAEKLSEKYKILFFELEMTDVKLGLRRIAAKSYIPLNRLYEPNTLTDDEYKKMIQVVSQIEQKGNMIIDTTPRISLDQLRSRIHFIKNTQGVDLIILDHVGLMKMDKGYSSRNEWLGDTVAGLKALAKEFDVCMVILSQLSRGVEARTDKRPMLSDLRDSGSLEQDADVVLFLYRDGYYNKENLPDIQPLEVILAKNRDGMTGTINMGISLQRQLISEIYR